MQATDENKSYNTVITKMQQVAPLYIAKYVNWYLSEPDERCTWDELCGNDSSFKTKSGENKTEKFAKDNWLTREDTQRAIQIYMKHMKTYNTMRIYEKMLEKSLEGDVNAARWIEQFHDSDFFDESTDEIDEFLNKVNLPKLKKNKG